MVHALLRKENMMKQKGLKTIIGLFIAVFVMMFAGTSIAYAADEEDTRTHIDRVDISTNIDDVFGYGKENTTLQPTLQMSQTTSEPVTISPYYGKWQRCVDGNWVSDCEEFISGQWRMMIHIRVNDNDANLVDDETKVYVDDELWETWVAYDYGDANAYMVVIPSEDSERFFIEEPAELTFHKLEKYDISGQRVNSVIESYSVAPSVEGGTRPYSYRKASGPEWLEVSNEGTISGKPTEIGTNEPLVVEVLDSNGGSKQITISVGDTLEENIIEVSTWEELEAAFQWNKPEGLYTTSQREMEYFTIRLMEDLSTNVASLTYTDTVAKTFAIYRAYVTFDFNGHTLSCTDAISTSNYEYQFKDFIRIELHPNSYDEGSALRFTDSVGGGGIKMYSSRAYETCDLSALHLVSGEMYHYIVNSSAYNTSNADHYVYFDGGKYELEARSEKVSIGTLSRDVRYRGCVIAEDVRVEINDGHFYANGEGAKFSVGDTCARELAAFGTFAVGSYNYTVPIELVIAADGRDSVVINGGIFESNGYAVHHFDDATEYELGWAFGYMNFPTINGGYFIGQMGYTGHTFTYSDGTEFYNVLPATTVISENSYVIGIDKDGDRFYDLEDMTLKDLHDLQSCIVLGKETVQMKTTPVSGSYPASLIRESTQTETYTIEYKEPSWFTMGGIQCVPYYKIQGWNSGVTPTSKTGKTEVTVDYNKYRNNGGVDVKLGMMYLTPWNTTDYSFENEYNVKLQVLYDVTDACENIHIYPVNGEFRVVKGGDFSFTLGGGANYSISAVLPLDVVTEPYYEVEAVYGEGIKTTYTIRDVQEDVKIWVEKGPNGPTGQLNLKLEIRDGVLTNLGRISEGEEYTLLEPAEYAEYGFTVPDGYTFVKWIVTTPTSSFGVAPGTPFTLSGAGNVIISPKYENLYNIQVVNGTAYADAEHTQPISNAVDEQRVYIVADEPGEGKVFWKWNVIDGYNGIPVGEYANSETTYYVNMDDALLEACYATSIDEATLTILTEDIVPEAGKQVPSIEKVNREAYGFYTLYYYDVTDGGHTLVFPETQNFEAGHTYQLETEVAKVDGYLLADIDDMTLHIEGLSESEYESVELQSVYGYENERYKIMIHFPEIEGPEGVNVSGTVTSAGSESAIVEVTLTNVDNESISYVRLLVGNSTSYSIDGVMPGTYTLRVTKAKNVTYEETITVGEENVVKDVELELAEVTEFYILSFAANGGTGTMADVIDTISEYTLPDNGFTAPSGKKFKCWSVGGVEKNVGDKIALTADIVVTAIWEDIPTPTPTPTAAPTAKPTAAPTAKPTVTPTAKPTAAPTAKPTATPRSTPKPTEIENGWHSEDGTDYWYENGVKQGLEGRGKEIYDSATNAWYWLDSALGGAVAKSKDVYQESLAGTWGDVVGEDGLTYGKWVRYDENGYMIKGWQTTDAGKYYFDLIFGTMAKGFATIDGIEYYFDEATGILQYELGEVPENGWKTIDGNDYWYENYVRQGFKVDDRYRGKEIYDGASNAWYWLDNVLNGAKAKSKDVYQESQADDAGNIGKWVRYDAEGHMIKGWQTTDVGTCYFDNVYGTMLKGEQQIDGVTYFFDETNGLLIR